MKRSSVVPLRPCDGERFTWVGLSYEARRDPGHVLRLARRVLEGVQCVRCVGTPEQVLELLVVGGEVYLHAITGRGSAVGLREPAWGPREKIGGRASGEPVCGVAEPRAWDWLIAQLRWLVFSMESEAALSALSLSGRYELREALQRVEDIAVAILAEGAAPAAATA